MKGHLYDYIIRCLKRKTNGELFSFYLCWALFTMDAQIEMESTWQTPVRN